jgi:alkaline phosphatase D
MQTRRQFVTRAGSTAAVAVFAPLELAPAFAAKTPALYSGGRFRVGVASGDPSTNAITLWSALDDVGGRGQVALEVARDRDFKKVVARKRITTSSDLDHTVKARVSGLKAHERYYYRFETKQAHSPVGRFQTALPADSDEKVRFAFFSCQDYAHGHYNAHALMAKEDVDFVVDLGDYIYAEYYHPGATGVRKDIGVAKTTAEYREKYRLYRSDENLRAVHAKFPMIAIWDDHEVEDNYVGADPTSEDWDPKRKAAGYKAYFEHMPTYAVPNGKGSRIYRNLKFGRNLELFMLDQRQYRDNQPCDDKVGPACAGVNDPALDFLGDKQMGWIKDKLSASKARWKVIGNELMAMPAKVGPDTYYTFDMWHGYLAERRELLGHIRSKGIDDVVFITGDIHTFIAGDVRLEESDPNPVALEFVGGSITSQSLGETDVDLGGGQILKGNDAKPSTPPGIINALRGFNPWVDWADFDHHGYGLVEASSKELKATMRRVDTIKQPSRKRLDNVSWTVQRGQKSIVGKGVNTQIG